MLDRLLAATDEEIVVASGTADADFGVHAQTPIILGNTDEVS